MFNNFTPEFARELQGFNRKPITLIEFRLHNGRKYYLSDIEIGKIDGLDNNYLPWVESWGTLLDSSNEQTVFSGRALEAKSMQINIISTKLTRAFILDLYTQGIDNTIVTLYQLFYGLGETHKTIIDILACQDPIILEERSMLFRMDLVSTIMRSNNPLFPRKPGEDFHDIVVGKAIGLPLIELFSSAYTTLREDISDTYTGPVIVHSTVGFPGSGTFAIDSEFVTASVVNQSEINITARAQQGSNATSHLRDALISIYNANYDYAVCAGPVQLVDNLRADGEPYQHEYQALTNQDPVLIRFNTRPPWLNTVNKPNPPIQPPDVSDLFYGADYETDEQDIIDSHIAYPGNINSSSGVATMTLESETEEEEPPPPSSDTIVFESGIGICGGQTENGNPPSSNDLMFCNGFSLRSYCDDSFGENYLTSPGVEGYISHFFDGITAPRPDATIDSATLNLIALDGKACNADMEVWLVYNLGSEEVESDRELIENYTGMDPVFLRFDQKNIDLSITDWDSFNDIYVRFYNHNHNCGCMESQFCSEGFVQRVGTPTITVNYSWPVDPPPPIEYPTTWHELVSHFSSDLSNLGTLLSVSVTVKYNVTLTDAEVVHRIIQRSTNDPEDNTVLSEHYFTEDQASTEETFSLYVDSWGDLQNIRIGIYEQIAGPELPSLNRVAVCNFEVVEWHISYRPPAVPQPDTPVIVYARELTCDVTSLLGPDPTPAQVIHHLIKEHSAEGNLLDDQDFTDRHNEYLADSYFFNGIFPGNIVLHEAIKECLFQGLARLLFSHGKIKLLTYLKPDIPELNHYIPNEQVVLRSRIIKNQPTSYITNYINVLYHLEYGSNGGYRDKVTVEDQESISKFTYKVRDLEFSLVNSEPIAQMAADRFLELYKKPVSVLQMDIFMPEGFKVDKGDHVLFRDFLIEGSGWSARVLGMNRLFASGKLKQITKYSLLMNEPVYINQINELNLSDTVRILDSLQVSPAQIFDIPLDTVKVEDLGFDFTLSLSHLLTDSLAVDDSILEVKTNLNIGLADPVIMDDSGLHLIITIQHDLTDQVQVDDSILEVKTNLEVAGQDSVVVDDSGLQFANIIYGVLPVDVVAVSDVFSSLIARTVSGVENVLVVDSGSVNIDGPKLILLGVDTEDGIQDPTLILMGVM